MKRALGLTLGGVLAVVSVIALAVHVLSTDASALMGLPLPRSASDVRVDVRRESFAEHQAFIRFEMSPAEASQFFGDAFFSQQFDATDPHYILSSAVYRSQPLTDLTASQRPAWWQPASGRPYFLVYRSNTGPGSGYRGPDAAWYAVDKSDPQRYTVYVYLIDV
jgi:hypothetical protein